MLTVRQRLLGAVVQACGGARLERFDDRLLLQKRLYLLAAEGVDLGYVHSWYLRGPYCPALTRDAFAVDRENGLVGSTTASPLPGVIAEKVTGLRNALGKYWTDPSQLELLASVVFLSRTGSASSIEDRLGKLKPKYKSTEVDKAIEFATVRGWIK